MDGQKEVVDGRLHVALVESGHGIVILLVGLTFLQSRVDDVEIVVIAREVGDLCSYENVFSADGFLQTNALQRGATR